MISKFQFVEVNTLKLFLSQWNQYNHAETFLRGIVSAWLSICDYSGLPQPEKRCLFIRNETNSKNRKREKPCRTSIFAKRKRLIVSDTLVSKLSTLFGPSRRGVRHPYLVTAAEKQSVWIITDSFSCRSAATFSFICHRQRKKLAAQSGALACLLLE